MLTLGSKLPGPGRQTLGLKTNSAEKKEDEKQKTKSRAEGNLQLRTHRQRRVPAQCRHSLCKYTYSHSLRTDFNRGSPSRCAEDGPRLLVPNFQVRSTNKLCPSELEYRGGQEASTFTKQQLNLRKSNNKYPQRDFCISPISWLFLADLFSILEGSVMPKTLRVPRK